MANKKKKPAKGITLVKVDPDAITDEELDKILDAVLGPEEEDDQGDDEEDKE